MDQQVFFDATAVGLASIDLLASRLQPGRPRSLGNDQPLFFKTHPTILAPDGWFETSGSRRLLDLKRRSELIELNAARQQAIVELRYAENLLLPRLDMIGIAGQDVGTPASPKGDKSPFELQLGVLAEVPIQRREGYGKIQVAQGKLTQIDAKRRLTSDKIRAEILDAASAVNAAADQIEQSTENVRLNEQALELGRLAFEEGDIDMLALNIYESSIADARLQLLDAQYAYFYSLAVYQTMTQSEALFDAENIQNE